VVLAAPSYAQANPSLRTLGKKNSEGATEVELLFIKNKQNP